MTMFTLLKLFLMLVFISSLYRFIKIASDWDISLRDVDLSSKNKKKKK